MNKTIRIILAILVLLSAAIPSYSQADPDAEKKANEKLWLKWTDEAVTLYQQRKYSEAIALAEKALDIAEKTFGKDHPNVAESLDNLAIYKQAINKYGEAEDHYKRALAILEKNLAPDDHYLAIFMNYLAKFYRKIGKETEARSLEEQAKMIRSGAAGKKNFSLTN